MGSGCGCDVKSVALGGELTHAFSFQNEAVGIVDEAIEDGIGQCRIADDVVPVFDRNLAGDDGRRAAMAIVDDFEPIASRQSHTNIVHQMSPSGPVPAVQCVGNGGVARLPRTNTLDVAEDTSRVSARQPLSPAGEWRIDRPTHKEQSFPTHIRYGTKAGKRPDSANNITNTAARQKRGVRNHPEMTPTSQRDLVHSQTSSCARGAWSSI